MKTIHYYIYTTLVLAFIAMSCKASVADIDSTATSHYVHRLIFNYKQGAILHTNDFLRGNNPEERTMNHNMGCHLKYAFSAPEGSEQARIYRDAYQGIGVSYNDFNPQLGYPISVYLLQGARIASLSNRLGLNYEWNLGLTFGWNPYDEEENPDNRLIGSKVTAYIGLDLYLRWILSRHVDIELGVNATHYSNGNTQFPNLGLNTVALRLGATYYFNRHQAHIAHRYESLPPVEHSLNYDFVLYGAWRQRAVFEDGEPYMLFGKALVMGFNFNPLYRVNHWLKLGASLDATYDRSANLYYDVNYINPDATDQYRCPSAFKQMALGFSARAEFTMPYFAINFGIGKNILNANDAFSGIYELLALKVSMSRHAFIHIGYSLNDFHTPQHLMLGIGWHFGKL